MLEFLTARLLISACVLADVPSESAAAAIERLASVKYDDASNWMETVSRLICKHVPRLGIRVERLLTLDTIHLFVHHPPLVSFAEALGGTALQQMHLPLAKDGKPVFEAVEWQRVVKRDEEELRGFSVVPGRMTKLFPECRMPRRLKTGYIMSASDMARRRKCSGRWVIDQGRHVYMHKAFVGPFDASRLDDLSKLWLPPWVGCDRRHLLTQCGLCLSPPFSTYVCHVPDKILGELPASLLDPPRPDCERSMYRVSCRFYHGHTRPEPMFLADTVARERYPYLIQEWNFKNRLQRFRGSIQLGIHLIVPYVLVHGAHTKDPEALIASVLDASPLASVQKDFPSTTFEIIGCDRGKLDFGRDLGLCLSAKKWEMLKIFGPLDDLTEAMQQLFDRLHACMVNGSNANPGNRLDKCAVFLFIPEVVRKWFPNDLVDLQASIFAAGFNPSGGKSCFETPNLADWMPKTRKGYPMSSISNRDLFMSTFMTLLQAPVLLNEYPCQMGHLMSLILTEFVCRFLTTHVADYVKLNAVLDLLGELTTSVTRNNIPPDPIMGRLSSLKIDKDAVVLYLQALTTRRELIERLEVKGPYEYPFDHNLNIMSIFPKALQTCLVTFGAPAPVLVASDMDLFARVTPLGNLMFDVGDSTRKDWTPPWTIAKGDKDLDEMDEEVLSSEDENDTAPTSPRLHKVQSRMRPKKLPSKAAISPETAADMLQMHKMIEEKTLRLHQAPQVELLW
eukprot:Blabericola_migrator_1__6321@NODE_318_length_9886_cov_105_778796_g259_i0_p1_GENE_NODE_318_length_9886_cov_105_778796_g259_i0NODE_318_length_9886_cov_105_778796_g259_i0_p1_ORF_typecomplete_len734_score123_46_NODE_318_length_9886_cov_105_778796_g259_i066198820